MTLKYKSVHFKDYQLCTDKHDPFIEDEAIWIVHLNNGIKIYQDDGRRGIPEYSAWIRLGNYIRESGCQIVGFDLKFGSHLVSVFGSKNAYYFSRGVESSFGNKETTHFYIIGSIDDFAQPTFKCKWYIVPALEIIKTVEKITDKATPPRLIYNNI